MFYSYWVTKMSQFTEVIQFTTCCHFQNKDKLEKLRIQAESFCQRLGKYRMPFAWATVNIMSVISTATLDRDIVESDSTNGKVVTLCRSYSLFLAIRL